MKKVTLLIIGLMFLNLGLSQKQQVKLKNPVVYQVENKKDSLLLSPSEINLEVAEWAFDSCDYYSNNFEFQFEIKNTTKKTIMCNSTLDCWNDSGLMSANYLQGNSLTIAPGETGKITVRVMPYQKRKMTSSREFIIVQNDLIILASIRLKFACTSVKSCEKSIYGPQN